LKTKKETENFIVYNNRQWLPFNACARLAPAYLDLTSCACSLAIIPLHSGRRIEAAPSRRSMSHNAAKAREYATQLTEAFDP